MISPRPASGAATPFARSFGRLSTGLKMLIILSMALLPLGIIALLASIQSAQVNRQRRVATIRVIAIDSADRLDLSLTRTVLAMRAAGTALAENSASVASCRHTVAALDAAVHLQGPDGMRAVPLTELHRLPEDRPDLETVLRPGELIAAVELPALPRGARSPYRKVRDRSPSRRCTGGRRRRRRSVPPPKRSSPKRSRCATTPSRSNSRSAPSSRS